MSETHIFSKVDANQRTTNTKRGRAITLHFQQDYDRPHKYSHSGNTQMKMVASVPCKMSARNLQAICWVGVIENYGFLFCFKEDCVTQNHWVPTGVFSSFFSSRYTYQLCKKQTDRPTYNFLTFSPLNFPMLINRRDTKRKPAPLGTK